MERRKLYADVVIEISQEKLDKTYQYEIPEALAATATVGTPVRISFGRGTREITGYIVSVSSEPKLEPTRIKPLLGIQAQGLAIESRLIQLALCIHERFGGTMIEALKTVLPVKRNVRRTEDKQIELRDAAQAELLLQQARQKKHKARERLLSELLSAQTLTQSFVTERLRIPRQTLTDLEQLGVLAVTRTRVYRNPMGETAAAGLEARPVLNVQQKRVVDQLCAAFDAGERGVSLLHGVTGSGKTEVYMELISHVIAQGYQAILLIPEIALTYQTVLRFQRRFGTRVSFLHSRLSAGERFDQSERAKQGEIDVMIGPRSALFTPFERIGLILIDEEHESSYKSESVPKYHAREVAITYAEQLGAMVLLGSATPSIESYYRARSGAYRLFTLTERANDAVLPTVHIVDLREELRQRNRSIFSGRLKSLIEDRLQKKEQILLFLNRRGYAGGLSCRSCGAAYVCPHCSVSLKTHLRGRESGRLVCHYCGHIEPLPQVCKACGSPYIASFGTGTQKVEELVHREFPTARVLRMDADTTKQKDAHERILAAFLHEEADILIGTQMIVKGHDFPKVTLVGILAADLSLNTGDYRAAERTFQLLAQAAGRAGRGALSGEVVIQTYQPEHYSVLAAAHENYEMFYENELAYRCSMQYPPIWHLLVVLVGGATEEAAERGILVLAQAAREFLARTGAESVLLGPAPAGLSKAKDVFRSVFYIKERNYETLIALKACMETYGKEQEALRDCAVQFDFDPMSGY